MRKKSDKELGVVLPEGMVDTINNRDLTDAQVGKIIRAITWNSMEYAQDDIVAKQLTTSLIGTYRTQNRIRITRIKMVRGWKSEYEKKKRERAKLAEEKLLQQADDSIDFHGNSMDFHGATIGRKERNNNTPIIPLAGDKKSSSAKAEAVAPETAPENEPSERPTKGHSTGGSRTGTTKRLKGKPGTTAAPATQEDQPTASRGAATSKKIGGGRCRWMDAEGLCTSEKMQGGGFKCIGCENREPIGADGAAPAKPGARTLLGTGRAIKGAAQRMMDAHPNAKSGERAVVRALAQTIEDEGGDAEATLGRIEEAHAAWCATDGWAADKGQFVQALAAWIRNGGWRKMPPQKKKAPPQKGDEMSFGASL